MKSKRLLVASLSKDEAITNCIINNLNHFDTPIDVIFLDELLHDYEYFDELNDNGAIIRWFKDEKRTISNQSHEILNRVLYVPDELFFDFNDEDRDYAKHEFEAYLGFSFNSFQGVGNKLGCGINAPAFSLPQQWKMVAHNQYLTPDFYWGPQDFNPMKNKENSLVYSDIFNYMNWSIKSRYNGENHVFCFEKPQGTPVFLTVLGSQIFAPGLNNLCKTLKDNIYTKAKNITSLFESFAGEILFFVQEEKITFGCFNPEIIHSRKHYGFNRFVLKHLIDEFQKCLN